MYRIWFLLVGLDFLRIRAATSIIIIQKLGVGPIPCQHTGRSRAFKFNLTVKRKPCFCFFKIFIKYDLQPKYERVQGQYWLIHT